MKWSMDRVYRLEHESRWGYIGLGLHTYQVTLGITLRWYRGQPHIRAYVGPVKAYAGLFLREPRVAFSGGDR